MSRLAIEPPTLRFGPADDIASRARCTPGAFRGMVQRNGEQGDADMPSFQFPQPISNCNPGALVHARDEFGIRPNVGGFAQFATMERGLHAYLLRMWSTYTNLGKRTLYDYCAETASLRHHDLTAYIDLIGRRLNISPLGWKVIDLELHQPWRAFDMARAQMLAENGSPPASWLGYPEWITPRDLAKTMHATGRWNANL